MHADVSGIGPEGLLYHVPKAGNVRSYALDAQALEKEGYLCQEKLDGVCPDGP